MKELGAGSRGDAFGEWQVHRYGSRALISFLTDPWQWEPSPADLPMEPYLEQIKQQPQLLQQHSLQGQQQRVTISSLWEEEWESWLNFSSEDIGRRNLAGQHCITPYDASAMDFIAAYN